MDVAERFCVPADEAEVWRVITDVPAVLSCVPGISGVVPNEDGSYRATIAASLGPTHVEFRGQVWCEFQEAEMTAVVLAKGRDRFGTTQVASEVRLAVERDRDNDCTAVDIRGEIEFAGALAAAARLGGKVVADSLVRGLAERLEAKLRATHQ